MVKQLYEHVEGENTKLRPSVHSLPDCTVSYLKRNSCHFWPCHYRHYSQHYGIV